MFARYWISWPPKNSNYCLIINKLTKIKKTFDFLHPELPLRNVELMTLFLWHFVSIVSATCVGRIP